MRSVGWKSFVAHFGVVLSISSCGQANRGNPEPSATTPEPASTSVASKQEASGRLTDAKSAAPRSAGEHRLNLASPPVPLAFVTVETAVWEQKAGAGPAARYEHSLAFDGTRGKVVLFGGRADDFSPLGDTWEWDGTSWTEVTIGSRPPARSQHALTYDSARRRVVLFGGNTSGADSGGALEDTWDHYTFGGGCSSELECKRDIAWTASAASRLVVEGTRTTV